MDVKIDLLAHVSDIMGLLTMEEALHFIGYLPNRLMFHHFMPFL